MFKEPTMSEHDQLDTWLRQSQKLSEEERSIMLDEPCDVIKNLELLTALRKASEAEAPPNRSTALSKSRKKRSDMEASATESPGASSADKSSRSKAGVPRSASVSSTQARESRGDAIAVKVEDGAEGTKGTVAERSGLLVVGSQVVYKHNKNKHGVEGEGIQCIIKNISGDGHKKRYGYWLSFDTTFQSFNPRLPEYTTSKIPNQMRTANKVPSSRRVPHTSFPFRRWVLACLHSRWANKSWRGILIPLLSIGRR